MNTHILRLGVLLLSVTVSVIGGDGKSRDRAATYSLRGLQGVNVLIESLSSEAEQAGLNSTTIQTDVELKLRLAGIKVLSEEESLKQSGHPYLYVNANVNPGLTLYSIHCKLKQGVTLSRDVSITTIATTWETSASGLVEASNLLNIRSDIKDLVDQFINDYLSVNPKK
jgi:hypothetical protein